MRSGGKFVLWIVALVLGALPASAARAWTDASVSSVRANVDIDAHGTALVTIALRVRVHGGWLTDIDVDGLDSDLSLDGAGSPWAVDEAGVAYAPVMRVLSDGRVRLQFDRHNAPRRGSCEIGFHYRTELGHRATLPSADGEHIRIRWTLPAWQTGLDGVVLTASVPGRSRAVFADNEDRDVAVVSDAFENGKTTITYRRVHLPRTTPWTIEFEAPASAMDASLGTVRSTPSHVAVETAPVWPLRLGIAILLLCLLVAKERLLSRHHVGVRPLIAMPGLLRAALVLTSLAWVTLTPRTNALGAVVGLAAICVFGLVRSDGARLPMRAIRRHLSAQASLTIGTVLGSATYAGLVAAFLYVAALPFASQSGNSLLLYVMPVLVWPAFVTGIEGKRAPPVDATSLQLSDEAAR